MLNFLWIDPTDDQKRVAKRDAEHGKPIKRCTDISALSACCKDLHVIRKTVGPVLSSMIPLAIFFRLKFTVSTICVDLGNFARAGINGKLPRDPNAADVYRAALYLAQDKSSLQLADVNFDQPIPGSRVAVRNPEDNTLQQNSLGKLIQGVRWAIGDVPSDIVRAIEDEEKFVAEYQNLMQELYPRVKHAPPTPVKTAFARYLQLIESRRNFKLPYPMNFAGHIRKTELPEKPPSRVSASKKVANQAAAQSEAEEFLHCTVYAHYNGITVQEAAKATLKKKKPSPVDLKSSRRIKKPKT